jgi:hypothetical protein
MGDYLKLQTGKASENSLIRKPSREWEDNIRVDLKEICRCQKPDGLS